MTETHDEQSLEISDAPISRAPGAIRVIIVAGAFLLAGAGVIRSLDLDRALGLLLYTEQYLFGMLGGAFLLVFLHLGADRKPRAAPVPWYDWLCAVAGTASCGWLAVRYPQIADIVSQEPPEALITGTIIMLLTAEGLRRTAGPILLGVLIFFIAFGMIGQFVPGQLQGRPIAPGQLVTYLTFDTNSLVGAPMKVVTTVVIAFLLFGALLFRSGGSTFFTELSSAIMGRTRGGSAKIAVVASSLFGTISGSAVSNVLSTGVVTIPLMRRAGYRPHMAAAIEAVASTGGQLMPPVMGAVAFIMAEYLDVPYTQVVIAAIVPSVLYYVSLFIQADLEAARAGIAPVPRELIPRLIPVLRSGGVFAVPFFVLIYGMFWMNLLPEEAALYSAGTLIVIGLVLGYRGTRMGWRDIFDAIARTGVLVLDLVMIGAAVGLIIGILNQSGLGFALTLMLVNMGSGHLLLLLLLAGAVCFVLGMGMPTIAVYILVATLIAPAMVETGINPMAAHMFVLYLAMLSFITPPVCIAAFAAANLARADPMITGLTATRFGWSAFVVPFLFVFEPSLLLQGTPLELVHDVGTAIAGVWIASMGLAGYSFLPIGWLARSAYVVTGLVLLVPASLLPGHGASTYLGIALAAALLARDFRRVRRARSKATPAPRASQAAE
ncbi:MAG TPA: TRAP transporter fused permease subunit [Xanthobacteraceae bacterium]